MKFFLSILCVLSSADGGQAATDQSTSADKPFIQIKSRFEVDHAATVAALLDDAANRMVDLALAAGRVPTKPPIDDLVEPSPPRFRLDGEQFDQIVQAFTSRYDRGDLDRLLRQKVETYGRVFGLTKAQRKKLELAGRGDIERHFDRIDGFKRKVEGELDQKTFDNAVRQMCEELLRYQESFEDGSLFSRMFSGGLSARQRIIGDAIREIEKSGGRLVAVAHGGSTSVDITLQASSFADEDLRHAEQLIDLDVLRLNNSHVTDAGVAHIGHLTMLKSVNLSGTQTTDAGLKHLAPLTSLVLLRLSRTQITDAGVEQLKDLPRLWYLDLEGTAITDSGLRHLAGSKKLESLFVRNTRVTESGVAELRKSLKWVQIHR